MFVGVFQLFNKSKSNLCASFGEVMDKRLGEVEFLAGDADTLADIATYPWVARCDWHPCDINDFGHVKRWYNTLSERESVKRGLEIPNV